MPKLAFTREEILKVALTEPVIWDVSSPSNSEELSAYRPLGYAGQADGWRFLVIRYELSPGQFQHDGTAIYEIGAVVIHIDRDAAQSIFNKAHAAYNLCKNP